MTIFDYKDTDLLFSHWLRRKGELIGESGGRWMGNLHPEPIVLHRMIDDRLDMMRPMRNPNCSIYL